MKKYLLPTLVICVVISILGFYNSWLSKQPFNKNDLIFALSYPKELSDKVDLVNGYALLYHSEKESVLIFVNEDNHIISSYKFGSEYTSFLNPQINNHEYIVYGPTEQHSIRINLDGVSRTTMKCSTVYDNMLRIRDNSYTNGDDMKLNEAYFVEKPYGSGMFFSLFINMKDFLAIDVLGTTYTLTDFDTVQFASYHSEDFSYPVCQ